MWPAPIVRRWFAGTSLKLARSTARASRRRSVVVITMSPDAIDTALETNAYAISYRLLGDRPAARAVAGISAERLRQVGGMTRPDWMYLLVEFTLDQTVEPGVLAVSPNDDDPYTGLRTALRRRLERAAPDERVAGSLICFLQ